MGKFSNLVAKPETIEVNLSKERMITGMSIYFQSEIFEGICLYDGPVQQVELTSTMRPTTNLSIGTVRSEDGEWVFKGKLYNIGDFSKNKTASFVGVEAKPQKGTVFKDGKPLYTGGFSFSGHPYGKGVCYYDDYEVHAFFLSKKTLSDIQSVVIRRGDLYYPNPIMPKEGFRPAFREFGPSEDVNGVPTIVHNVQADISNDESTDGDESALPAQKKRKTIHEEAISFVTEHAPQIAEEFSSIMARKNEKPEGDVADAYKKVFTDTGYKVDLEYKVNVADSYIKIDMVIENDNGEVGILEIKPACDVHTFSHAMGQIRHADICMRQVRTETGDYLPYEKARRAKKCARVIALPEKPHNALITNAEMDGLQVLWLGSPTPPTLRFGI